MNDIEISHSIELNDIGSVAERLGLNSSNVIFYGNHMAKIDYSDIDNKDNYGKLILVTSINPTPYGEGKTTVSIGLCDAISKLGLNASLALREPSMGPVFGIKGGACGGGHSQIVPMENINLNFTGDFAAIESANNLLAAAIDNHIEKGNKLDFQKVTFRRCLDVNDRSLRTVKTKLSDTSFDITAASEVMALFCLSKDIDDLKIRLGNIICGYNSNKQPIYAKDLNIEGALTVILKDAIKPNLVQTLEGNPAIVHGGPFANIAQGTNSVIATKTSLTLSDYTITEAGFGSDLGAEKFFDIKCRLNGLKPDCCVIVATVKALKYNAGVTDTDILTPDPEKVREGLPNLSIHIQNMLKFNSNIVVCINKYDTDSQDEVNVIEDFLNSRHINYAVSTAYKDGGDGAISLANEVLNVLNNENKFNTIYDLDDDIFTKIDKVAKEIYRSSNVEYSSNALSKLNEIKNSPFKNYPICISKTQYSISDDAKKLNAPINNTLHVRDVRVYGGAGFITILTGNVYTMPGLPKNPNYEKIDLVNGKVIGLE